MNAPRCQCPECAAYDARVRVTSGRSAGDPAKPDPAPAAGTAQDAFPGRSDAAAPEHPCCRGVGGHEAWCRSGAAIIELAAEHGVVTAEELPEQVAAIEEARNGPALCGCASCTAAYRKTLRRFAVSVPYPRSPRGLDDPCATGRADPPCCESVDGGWCVLEQKHAGKHVPGAKVRELPVFTFERGRRR